MQNRRSIIPQDSIKVPQNPRRRKRKAMPHTTNWYIQLLTLTFAAACLWLATACGNNGARYAIGDRITPSAPCGPNVPLTPSIEYITLEGAKVPSGYEKSLEAAKNPGLIGIPDAEGREMFIESMRALVRSERLKPELERIRAILEKYHDRIQMHEVNQGGHVEQWYVESIRTDSGKLTDKMVIRIEVTEHVDQSKFPSEHRIPECMDGVPVHFVVVGELEFENPRHK